MARKTKRTDDRHMGGKPEEVYTPPAVIPAETTPPPRATPDQILEALRTLTPGKLAAGYVELRSQYDGLEEQKKEVHADMVLVTQVIHEKLDELEQKGFRTADQVVCDSYLVTHRVTDPEVLREYILTDPEKFIPLIEMRASKEGVQAYGLEFVELGDDGQPLVDDNGQYIPAIPPGVEQHTHRRLSVRKA
jgi:gamma-glutamylcyclotransferase (GGCT)/AIG2-like uncharacterized protein YtfP